MSGTTAAADGAPLHDVRGVLAIVPFRRLWGSMSISSFGDWLGLLATTAMAAQLGGLNSYASANLAVSGVLILRLLPAIVFGPLAGVVADRFNRRTTMVVGDILRGALYVTIPIVNTLPWLFAATVLIEAVGLFWTPAKDASVPNLVPRERLEAANQLTLASTYGSAPFAALTFSGLALLSGLFANALPFTVGPNDIALYLNALSYFWAAIVVARLDLAPVARAVIAQGEKPEGLLTTMTDGWRFVAGTPLVRGLVLGMLGAFGAGGFVIGVAPTFARDLGAGSPGYGVLFASVFTGLALGMWMGPRLLRQLPRWRLFALAIVIAGLFLAGVALVHFISVAALLTLFVGAAAGIAWVTGYTMLGLEVDDELRGRTFAFVQSAARVVLVAVMAIAPGLAALLGNHTLDVTSKVTLHFDGTALTLLVAAVIAIWIGVASYRTMDDHGEVTLLEDVKAAFLPATIDTWWLAHRVHNGLFIAFEGGDGVGKSTQLEQLRRRLTDDLGHEVVVTREPGATELGKRIRQLLLHGDDIDPRAEALLFAADRAQHVADVIRPALERGAVVITDRYVDSSVAYQGSGRALGPGEIQALSSFATQDLNPDLTILLDVAPEVSARRRGERGGTDRMEAEDQVFHDRVRLMFLTQARRNPRRYLILEADRSVDEVAGDIAQRVEQMLPESHRRQADRQARRLHWRGAEGSSPAKPKATTSAEHVQTMMGADASNGQVLNARTVDQAARTTVIRPHQEPGQAPDQELAQPAEQTAEQARSQTTGQQEDQQGQTGNWNAPWQGR